MSFSFEETKKFHKASKDYIDNGNYPNLDDFRNDKNKNVFIWIQRIEKINNTENISDTTLEEFGTVNSSACWLIYDRIDVLMSKNKLSEAEQLIHNFSIFDPWRSEQCMKRLSVYKENYKILST
eukprot:jgi/Orpsp1_1/1190613/evm.model.d7180000080119.1